MAEENNTPSIYQIRIEGRVDPKWSTLLNGLNIEVEDGTPPITNLSGPIVDQAKLRGIMNKLWDLNLAVISVVRMETQEQQIDIGK